MPNYGESVFSRNSLKMPRRPFYPARVTRDRDGLYRVNLRDMPEIRAKGKTLNEAIDRAVMYLERTITDRALRGGALPTPTALRSNELLI